MGRGAFRESGEPHRRVYEGSSYATDSFALHFIFIFSAKPAFQPNEEALTMIMAMGFTTAQATKALEATGNNVERAADWIFSHAAELDSDAPPPQAGSQPAEEPFRDGSSRK